MSLYPEGFKDKAIKNRAYKAHNRLTYPKITKGVSSILFGVMIHGALMFKQNGFEIY